MSWLRRLAALPLWAMLWKELVQLRRDRMTLGLMLGIPAIQLALFGYAIQTEVRHLPTAVLDESRSSESRRLIEVFQNSGNFDVVARVADRTSLARAIETGRVNAGLVIPPDFMRDLRRGRRGEAQVLVDAADPLASSAALSGAQLAAAARSAELSGTGPPALDIRVRPWYNPGLRSAVYIVPGIIGVLLSLTLVLITSMAIVRERERGTLEQLIVTPIDKTSLVLGKILPFLLIGYVQITVILVLGRLLFRVPILGSLPLLYLLSLAFIVASLALGLLMSTLVQSQVQAMQLSFLFLLPNILLSGFMFPRQAMPAPAQWVGATLPLTYFLTILRGVLLKGVGLSVLWPEALALVGFSVGLVVLSVLRFHKTLE
ncbi:MAG TPA: ABC transporter permease [Gemmatimonadales bacterium]|nr:ABC transporter permease [Gemmatimonadales bacterium]